eukprot:3163562-Pleurochrysis_carterae.AAC.2
MERHFSNLCSIPHSFVPVVFVSAVLAAKRRHFDLDGLDTSNIISLLRARLFFWPRLNTVLQSFSFRSINTLGEQGMQAFICTDWQVELSSLATWRMLYPPYNA